MSALRITYLVLAILGAILPMKHFLPWLAANGWDMGAMIDVWNANDATAGLVYDLTVSAAALAVFIVAETMARRDWWVLLCIPAIFLVGVSFALPLYLFLRARPVR
jgi:hypothetical protein